MEERKKMSVQMMKSIMLAFQAAIKDEKDIMEIFQSFEIVNSDNGLVVLNPPVLTVEAPKKEETEE